MNKIFKKNELFKLVYKKERFWVQFISHEKNNIIKVKSKNNLINSNIKYDDILFVNLKNYKITKK